MARSLLPVLAAAGAFLVPATAGAATHGDLVSSKQLTSTAALTAAAKDTFVTYRTRGVSGRLVRVTGSVAVPKGKAPAKGWPVFTYAHGTTGIADACAPTRNPGSSASSLAGYHGYAYPFLNRVLKAGFAVVRTDYEGLGGQGEHPFYNGGSAGRSVLDAVRAARRLDRRIGRRVVVGGHSQGGHAALWAASLAKRWTPELTLRGTVAFAPASHLEEQGRLIKLIDTRALSPLIGVILRGADVAKPGLGIAGLLSDAARAIYPHTLTRCMDTLRAEDSWGGISARDVLRPDADIAPVIAYLRANDPELLTVRGGVLVLQGAADTTVSPGFTDQLVTALKKRASGIAYRTYAGVGHGAVVTEPAPANAALAYIRKRA